MTFLVNEELWKILFVSPNSRVLRNENGVYSLGVCIPEYKTIYIANNINGKLLYRVLCHELTHAEFISRGLLLPEYIEECLADIIADNIVDVNYIARNVHNNLCKYYGKC